MNSWEFYSRIEMFKHAQKDDELAHYGITGQKWGKRRWQYADGRFNPEGKERYFGSKSKKENSSDTGVKDYIKYKNESSDEKQKFGSTYFWNDDTRRVHNDSYQNADGSLTKKGEKLLAKSQNGNEKAANKIKAKALIDMDLYNEYSKDNENSKNIDSKEEKALQKEADKIDKAFAKGNIGTLNLLQSDKTEQIRKEANESFNKNCSEELSKLKDLYKDYDDNSEYYYALTGLANSLVFGNTKVGDMANMIFGYVYDDFDQGSGSSGHVYLLDKGYTKDDMTNMCKTNSENNEKFKNDIDLSISKDPLFGKTNERVKIQLRNALHDGSRSNLINKDANDYNEYSYRLQESGDTNADYSNRIKQNLSEAKKILNKVNDTCSNKEYGWWYFNKAIDELGYSDINYKDLTDSDWNKINEKVRELG